VPDWTVLEKIGSSSFPFPIKTKAVEIDPETGRPNKTTCDSINNNNWSMYYLTYSTSKAVGDVYDNVSNLRDKFVAYWKKVASKFVSNPYVVGYELMNEPFAGNIYKNPLLLVPGAADRLKLQPLYDAVNAAIREVDNKHLILFQGVTWEVVLPIGEKYGFTHAPGGEKYASKSILSWHCSVLPNWTPDPKYFDWKMSEIQRLQTGGWVTEIGAGESYSCFLVLGRVI
jgi:endoglycosylceramidase